MPNMLIIAKESKELVGLSSELIRNGFECSILPNGNALIGQLATQAPDLILVELNGYLGTRDLVHKTKQESPVPIIALVARGSIDNVDGHLLVDDFLISPYDTRELVLRSKRLLNKTRSRNGEVIRCGDLLIDQVKCEVTLSGKVVMLTFKEYELLKFLASNPDCVFTRETLLNSVWRYDYYGGDRTVDVHITRLRSKIEDSSHTFIKTVRNIGYRFKRDI